MEWWIPERFLSRDPYLKQRSLFDLKLFGIQVSPVFMGAILRFFDDCDGGEKGTLGPALST
jgi:hypothetical protein